MSTKQKEKYSGKLSNTRIISKIRVTARGIIPTSSGRAEAEADKASAAHAVPIVKVFPLFCNKTKTTRIKEKEKKRMIAC